MMTVGFGRRPCICLLDRRGTESILGDWSGENVVKVTQWLSHILSPPFIFISFSPHRSLSLSLSAITLSSFFRISPSPPPIFFFRFLLFSVWAPDSLSLLILPLWHNSLSFRHVSKCRGSGGDCDWLFAADHNHRAPHCAHYLSCAKEEG